MVLIVIRLDEFFVVEEKVLHWFQSVCFFHFAFFSVHVIATTLQELRVLGGAANAQTSGFLFESLV